ncbi:hypothetical protein BRC86_12410 [Halobacteriales archaeon QS_3_64_16]|nr:MAG: hypothetical protein BRC86_12410 [Halobacteriales archaeon QS_3_64_16]
MKNLISNFKHPDEADDEPIIEDIKYPLRFGGAYDGPKASQEKQADSVSIPPQEYRLLETKEEIDLFSFSRESPVHAMAFLFLPHQFVKKGLHPTFQGIVDSGYPGKPLSIVIHNGNNDRKIEIDYDQRICYIMFQYVDASQSLDNQYRTSVREPREEIREAPQTSNVGKEISELRDGIDVLKNRVEDLEDVAVSENIDDV